jgi:uncharacterized Fe-S cluster protein YjdI/CDGSH-type Zn-finger protein
MDKDNRSYKNKEITVHWKPRECVHAGVCFRELRKVFDPSRRPWVDMSQSDTASIIDIVDRCPTDALTYERNVLSESMVSKPTESNNKSEKVNITIMRNGPILAEGEFTIIGADGKKTEITSITSFCRCGMSKNPPFCDGTHNKRGFFPDEPSY